MTLLLAGTLILAGAFITYQASVILSLKNRIRTGDIALDESLSEASQLREELDQWKFPHPPTRGMTDEIDAEAIIANSDDPVWGLVQTNYDLKSLWEDRSPDYVRAMQPHQRYSQFATFVLNLSEGEQNREGIAKAIACMDAVA